MKKIILYVMLIVVLFITGCSEKATLNVYNDTPVTISLSVGGDNFQLDNDEYYSDSWDLGESIFGNESKDVNVDIEKQLYLFSKTYKISLSPGDDKNLHINYDAGAIQLTNDTDVIITGVYLSPVNEDNWGANDLSGEIYPYDSVTWNVSSGNWDIRIEFADDDVLIEWDQHISVGETLDLLVTTDKKGKDTGISKLENSKKFQNDKTKDKIEFIR